MIKMMNSIQALATLGLMQVDKSSSAYQTGRLVGQVFGIALAVAVIILVIWGIRKALSRR